MYEFDDYPLFFSFSYINKKLNLAAFPPHHLFYLLYFYPYENFDTVYLCIF